MSAADLITLASVFFTLVVVVPVVAAAWADVQRRRLAVRERELELGASQSADAVALYTAQVERLEQRVQVLERERADFATPIESPRARASALGEWQ
jgi:hypothetical protein